MAYTKKKVVLGATDDQTKDRFDEFNNFVMEIIFNMIDNKSTRTRQLAKVIGGTTIKVYLNSINGKVTVGYNTGDVANISKTFTTKAEVKTEFAKLVLA